MGISPRDYLDATERRVAHVLAPLGERPLVLACSSGLLTLAAAYLPGCWWLIFFSLVPLICAVRRAESWLETLRASGVYGALLIGGMTASTLFASVPGYAGAFGASVSFLLVFLSWLLFFVPLVPTVIAWALVARTVSRIHLRSAIGLSVLWVILEWVRMYLFNIATYSPGVDNPPFFSAGALGYVLADSESFLQLAALGGVYLMSGAVVVVNLFFYMAFREGKLRRIAYGALALLLVAVTPVSLLREAGETRTSEHITVGIMSLYPEHLAHGTPVNWSGTDELDLILLPEGAATSSTIAYIPKSLIRPDSRILSTQGAIAGGVYANVAHVETAGGGTSTPVRAKAMLAAQGEYITGAFLLLARMLDAYGPALTHHMIIGKWGDAFLAGDGIRVSVLFCVEMLAPGFGKTRVVHDESALLALAVSHTQFQGAPMLRVDSLRFMKVRAVEAGVPLVASSNFTPAYALDRYGQVIGAFGTRGMSEGGSLRIDVLSTGRQ